MIVINSIIMPKYSALSDEAIAEQRKTLNAIKKGKKMYEIAREAGVIGDIKEGELARRSVREVFITNEWLRLAHGALSEILRYGKKDSDRLRAVEIWCRIVGIAADTMKNPPIGGDAARADEYKNILEMVRSPGDKQPDNSCTPADLPTENAVTDDKGQTNTADNDELPTAEHTPNEQ